MSIKTTDTWETGNWWSLTDYLTYLFECPDFRQRSDFQTLVRVYGREKIKGMYLEYVKKKNEPLK